MKTEIAQVTCSDCNQTYFATLVEDGGRWTLGKRVPKPKNTSKCRKRRMLCGDCQGRGGAGDRLQQLMAQQRQQMRDMGLGGGGAAW